MDKHPRGAFTEDPALVGMPSWYAANGQYLTTKFFGMKANRYLHDHGISTATRDKCAAAVVLSRPNSACRSPNNLVYVRAVGPPTRRYGAYEVNTTYAPV